MYLLDTNVVSELRKAPINKANKGVLRWVDTVSVYSLYLSAISVLELEIGVLLMESRDANQGKLLRVWLDDKVIPTFSDRILPIDAGIARCCAKLHVPNPHSERDAMIAATALLHDMTVVTRNVVDFKETGVDLLNPWSN